MAKRWRGAAAGVVVAGLLAACPVAGATAGASGPTPAPGHVFELVQPGAVEVVWSAAASGPVSAYDVAPVVHGSPCPTCQGANTVGAGTTELELASDGGTVITYAVRATAAVGASAWVTARLPDTADLPAGRSPDIVPSTSTPTSAATPWVAQPAAGTYTSPLDTAPAGWTRTIVRDDGFSAPTANDGDLWVFGDTTVIDSPASAIAPGPVSCFTRNGTAAVAPPSLPPHLNEALEPLPTATGSDDTQCTGDTGALPAATSEPYQLLGDYPGTSPGVTCSNWVNGLANALEPTGGLSDGVTASYGSNCLNQSNEIVGVRGMWTTQYQVTSPAAQAITMPLGPSSAPDLPPVTCPAAALTTYDGGTAMTGNYSSLLDYQGYDYFYAPYGNSTSAFTAFGIPEATCSAMALARVPAGLGPGGTPYSALPGDYQYLLAGGRWETPGQAGLSPSALAAQSADVMPADYDGAYAGQVDVSQLADGELAMVYMLPDPLQDPHGGTDVAAVRTATSPAGPWSAPALFEVPGFEWGSDYQIVLHPELSTPEALALSYVVVSNEGGVTGRQVSFMTLSPSSLPAPGTASASGYREVAADGGLFAFGDPAFYGSMGGQPLNAPIVGTATTPAGGGYWEVAADGGLFAFGDAPFYGSMGGHHLNAPVVGMAAVPTGKGYWEVAADGGLFAFGDAPFYGSMGGHHLVAPIVGMAVAPTGKGYWEVAADGGVFAFGDARYAGSMGGHPLVAPIVGLAAYPTGSGYWEVAADGGLFAFGDARFFGSMGGHPLNAPIVGLAANPTGEGYWEVAADGGLFSFGSAGFFGSMGGQPLDAPVVGLAAG